MKKILLLLMIFCFIFVKEGFSAGTPSGTNITNQVRIKYDYGAIKNLEAVAEATIVVDNKVNVVVASLGNTSITPGQINCTIPFSITNTGNTPQRYKLSVGPYFSSDPNYVELTNIRIYLDADGSGTLTAGDIQYIDASTFGDINPDQTIRILIVTDAPNNLADGQFAQYYLIATTVDAGTTTETVQTSGNNTSGIDVVFADGSGIVDSVRDGKHSALGIYNVKSATVNINKEAQIVYDPITPDEPKANIGAIIKYKLTVTVTGEGTAQSVAIKDSVPAGTDYVAGTIKLNGNLLTDNDDSDAGKFSNGEVIVNLGDMTKSTPPQVIEFEVVVK